jgi:hypothetical protein
VQANIKKLRDYQVRLVTRVCRVTEDVLVEQPTGSGKTVQYRGDGRPVKLDGMRTYRCSLAEHMAEGFAPKYLES